MRAWSGADKRIRTADLILTKDVLCLLSYISMLTLPKNAKFPANFTLKVYHKIKKVQVSAGSLSAKDIIKSQQYLIFICFVNSFCIVLSKHV